MRLFTCGKAGFLFCLYLLLMNSSVFGQQDTVASRPEKQREKVYKLHLKYELPVSALALGTSIFGFQALDRTSAMDVDQVARLNPNDINAFDRPVAFADPSKFAGAHKTSDLFLNISILSPLVLMAGKEFRKDWLDLLTLYLVSHTVDNAVYFAAAFPIRRARPLTYNPGLAPEAKSGIAMSNSFFSGHVSFAATSTFFAAKVFTDYKKIKGWKRIAIFAGASVPPVMVASYRLQAGKHFRTDVITGFVIGAASGILVPELHRKMQRNDRLSLSPFFTPGATGATVCLRL